MRVDGQRSLDSPQRTKAQRRPGQFPFRLTKNGASPLTLAGALSYSGDTAVNGGTLLLFGDVSLARSPRITLGADGALSLASGQTLAGNGTVSGVLTAGAGSTVTPGLDGVGALTVSGAASLAGNTRIDLDGARGTNDVVRSTTSITLGGTLAVTNLGGALANGATFKLFDASAYSGAFATIQPATPGAGQTWDISGSAVDGTLKVLGEPGPATPPEIEGVTRAGGGIVLGGSGGPAGGNFTVLSSTDVTLPVNSWTAAGTGQFDANGNFTFTIPIDPNAPQRFFVVLVR